MDWFGSKDRSYRLTRRNGASRTQKFGGADTQGCLDEGEIKAVARFWAKVERGMFQDPGMRTTMSQCPHESRNRRGTVRMGMYVERLKRCKGRTGAEGETVWGVYNKTQVNVGRWIIWQRKRVDEMYRLICF